MKKKYLIVIIILYLAILIELIVFKYPTGMTFSIANANLIPFKTILVYFSGEPTWKIAIRNLLGNIVVLVPLGFLLAAMYQRLKWNRALLAGLFTGVVLELLQVIFKSGVFDIDDIILNFLGVIIGYLVFIFLVKFYNIFTKYRYEK
ncbi:VanZ family protein [bacterium]|nr:VanZ family protein [bacterium]